MMAGPLVSLSMGISEEIEDKNSPLIMSSRQSLMTVMTSMRTRLTHVGHVDTLVVTVAYPF